MFILDFKHNADFLKGGGVKFINILHQHHFGDLFSLPAVLFDGLLNMVRVGIHFYLKRLLQSALVL